MNSEQRPAAFDTDVPDSGSPNTGTSVEPVKAALPDSSAASAHANSRMEDGGKDAFRDGMSARPNRLTRLLSEEAGNMHLRLRLLNMLLFFCPHLCFNRVRALLYRLCGVRIGARTLIFGGMTLSGDGPVTRRLHIGEDCLINSPLHLNLNADIRIGNHVSIGHHVVMVTADHEIGNSMARSGALKPRPIVIEDGCWIGAGAMIAPGITVGRGSVIAMGAVVSMDVPPNKVVGGNPARTVKTLEG